MMVEMMVSLCKTVLRKWPQHEYPLAEVEEECQARALSAQNPYKGLTHPPSL